MKGRDEREAAVNAKCDEIVNKSPAIVKSYYASFKNGKTAASRESYIVAINQYIGYLRSNSFDVDNADSFAKVKPVDIDVYLDDYREGRVDGRAAGKKRANSSVLFTYNVLKSFYLFLYNNEYIQKDIFKFVSKPKNNNSVAPVYLTEEEIEKMKDLILSSKSPRYARRQNGDYWKTRDYVIFVLGCRTGLRCSALADINVEDIDFDEMCITVTEKGDVTRECYFGENTADLLKQWLCIREYLLNGTQCDALFISQHKKRISRACVEDMITEYASIAVPGKHITAHKMRATCATMTFNKTGDIYLVANQLGHKNLSNTMRYTGIATDKKKKVAGLLDNL